MISWETILPSTPSSVIDSAISHSIQPSIQSSTQSSIQSSHEMQLGQHVVLSLPQNKKGAERRPSSITWP